MKSNILYPTTKLWIMLFLILTIVFLPRSVPLAEEVTIMEAFRSYSYQYILILIIFGIALVKGKFVDVFKNFMRSAFVLTIIIFLMQSIFYPGEIILWEAGFIAIKKEGVIASINLTSKIMAICAVVILFFSITKVKDLAYSLEKMGISKKVSYVMLSPIYMIPQMGEKATVIMEAQNSRGLETKGNIFVRVKTLLPIFTPLVLSSLESSSERVLTLESRAFSSPNKKTNVYQIKYRLIDWIITALVVIATILFFIMLFKGDAV